MAFVDKKFNISELDGLSKNAVDQHLALYAGYVKNFNAISGSMADLMQDSVKNAHALAELERRLPFEFNGARLHEYYFEQWEVGAQPIGAGGALGAALAKQFGSYDAWEKQFRMVAAMRGLGWAILCFDPAQKTFHNVWIEQHHQGHFAALPIILALDVWEHAFVIDYGTTGRGKYIDACFKNYNWSVMEERYARIA